MQVLLILYFFHLILETQKQTVEYAFELFHKIIENIIVDCSLLGPLVLHEALNTKSNKSRYNILRALKISSRFDKHSVHLFSHIIISNNLISFLLTQNLLDNLLSVRIKFLFAGLAYFFHCLAGIRTWKGEFQARDCEF